MGASTYKHLLMIRWDGLALKGFCALILSSCVSNFLLAQKAGNRNSRNSSEQNKIDETFVCLYPSAATFPGGLDAWRKYLSKKINYPEIAQEHETEGIVKISMTVQKSGSVTDVYALIDAKDSLNEEAIRIIKASPKWRPATDNGHPTVCRFVQRITFQLEDDKKGKPKKSIVKTESAPLKTNKPPEKINMPPAKAAVPLLKKSETPKAIEVIEIPVS